MNKDMKVSKYEPDSLDKLCTKISLVMGGLSFDEQRKVIVQYCHYLEQEQKMEEYEQVRIQDLETIEQFNYDKVLEADANNEIFRRMGR